MSSNNLLDVPVEREIEVGEEAVLFIFKKDQQAKILLQKLTHMEELTDVIVSTRRKEYKDYMLLAGCSQTDSFSRDRCLHGSLLPHSYPRDDDPRDEQHDDSYLHDGFLSRSYQRDTGPPDGYPRDDDRDDSFSRDSYPCVRYLHDGYDSYSSDSHESVSCQPRKPRMRMTDGQPDMRCKENRALLLGRGVNINGDPDKRVRENRRDNHEFESCRPRKPRMRMTDGQPDMRCKENRALLLGSGVNINGDPDKRVRENRRDSHEFESCRPRKPRMRITDGQPDMRCKENRALLLGRGVNINGDPDKRLRENRREFTGLNNDGTCDYRFKVNKWLLGDSRRTEASPSTNRPKKVGPLNKDGTPDMRCKVNRAAMTSSYRSSSPCGGDSGTPSVATSSSWETPFSTVYTSGPLKKSGTPEMRYTVNKQRHGDSPAATSASRGPLKKDGTPDMRYAANRRESHNPPTPPSQARGPLKKNGTPDMRFNANRR